MPPPRAHLIMLLLDERPEEVTHFRRLFAQFAPAPDASRPAKGKEGRSQRTTRLGRRKSLPVPTTKRWMSMLRWPS